MKNIKMGKIVEFFYPDLFKVLFFLLIILSAISVAIEHLELTSKILLILILLFSYIISFLIINYIYKKQKIKFEKNIVFLVIFLVFIIFIILGLTGIWNKVELKENACETSYKQYYVEPHLARNAQCYGYSPACLKLNPSLKVTADFEFITCLCKNNYEERILSFFNSDIKNELGYFLVYNADEERYTYSGELKNRHQLIQKISADAVSICTLRKRTIE